MQDDKQIERAILQMLLLTDGSVIPPRNQISFASVSKSLIKQFCNLLSDVYGYQVKTIGNGKGTKQHLFLVQLKSKAICGDLLSDVATYRTSPFEDGKYPETKVPESWYNLDTDQLIPIMRALFDTEGGCSLRVVYIKKKHCIQTQRELFVSCCHPELKKNYKILLEKVGIKCTESNTKLILISKENFIKFRRVINFSKGILVGYDSKHWHGIEKRKLLDLMIKSYDIPHGFLQKIGKEQFYSLYRPPPK